MKFEDTDNKEVEAELRQYAHAGAAIESNMESRKDNSLPVAWHDQYYEKRIENNEKI